MLDYCGLAFMRFRLSEKIFTFNDKRNLRICRERSDQKMRQFLRACYALFVPVIEDYGQNISQHSSMEFLHVIKLHLSSF